MSTRTERAISVWVDFFGPESCFKLNILGKIVIYPFLALCCVWISLFELLFSKDY